MLHASPLRPSRLADHEVLPRLTEVARRDRATTAEMLVLIGRADADRLYAATEHDSMLQYCTHELHMSEDMAFKRIRVARRARHVPALLAMLADGRLHLSGAYLLAPHLRRESARALLAAATHRSKFEIEKLLAERFPKAGLPALATPLGSVASPDVAPSSCQLAPGPVAPEAPRATPPLVATSAPLPLETSTPELAPGPVAHPAPLARITPLGPDCTAIQFAFGDRALEKLRYAQALLGHALPSGDLAGVFERALDELVAKQERAKFAVTSRTRKGAAGTSANPRLIPAAVRREVLARDGGGCTFVSAKGRRCGSRRRLEFDHIQPVAKGGTSTATNLRLRCQTHNQHAAEQAFGAEFMARKRAGSRRKTEAKRRAARAAVAETARREAYARDLAASQLARANAEELMPWLRRLGFREAEARPAAMATGVVLPDASLEERVKHALRRLAPPSAHKILPSASSPP